MANDDLLHQFKQLLAENNKELRQDFREQLAENNKQIRKEIKEEVDPLHERMDTQYKNLSGQISTVEKNLSTTEKNLSGKIDQQAHEVADILSKAVMPDIDKHEVQIEELQKAVGLHPKH